MRGAKIAIRANVAQDREADDDGGLANGPRQRAARAQRRRPGFGLGDDHLAHWATLGSSLKYRRSATRFATTTEIVRIRNAPWSMGKSRSNTAS